MRVWQGKRRWAAVVLGLGLGMSGWADTPSQEALITQFLSAREALLHKGPTALFDMDQGVSLVLYQAGRLKAAGQAQAAMDKLKVLERHGPLMDHTSFEVHRLAASLYETLGHADEALAHQARADALKALITERLGKGDSTDTAIVVVNGHEVGDWAEAMGVRVQHIKSNAWRDGKKMVTLTYSDPAIDGPPRMAYFVAHLRAVLRMPDLTQPQGLSLVTHLSGIGEGNVARAKQKREQFLSDQFDYLGLIRELPKLIARAQALNQQRQHAAALATLHQIHHIRAVEDIPIAPLLNLYGELQAKVGNPAKAIAMTTLAAGIHQTIVQSGDGRSPATAVEVIATIEEYEWLARRQLTPVRQAVHDIGPRKFDVLTAKNTEGVETDYYFDITRLYAKYSPSETPSDFFEAMLQKNGDITLCRDPSVKPAEVIQRVFQHISANITEAKLATNVRVAQALWAQFPCPFSPWRPELAVAQEADVHGAWVYPQGSQALRYGRRSPAARRGGAPVQCEAVAHFPEGEYRQVMVVGQHTSCPFVQTSDLDISRQNPRVSSWQMVRPGRVAITRTDMPNHQEEWELFKVTTAFTASHVRFEAGDLLAYLRKEPGNPHGAATQFRHLQRLP